MNKETAQNHPRPNDLSRGEFLKLGLIVGGSLLTGCSEVITDTPESTATTIPPTFTSTSKPSATLEPTSTSTSTPSPTETYTSTPTPEDHDWNFVSQHTDEEIFTLIGTPDPCEYRLDTELSPVKILRNEGGQSYALFGNSEGIVFLAENLETGVVEHAVYAEHEGGVPIMVLTGSDVVEKDNGWFHLNEEYRLEDAQERFGEAFNRALAMKWFENIHRSETNGWDYTPAVGERVFVNQHCNLLIP
jgi:hypothetical protein